LEWLLTPEAFSLKPFSFISMDISAMEKMKQFALATLLSIVAMNTPNIVVAAGPNPQVDDCLDAEASHSCRPPKWTASVEAIILNRISSENQTLVERVPGIISFSDVPTTPGAQALNSDDFHQGFSTGPKIGLTYQGDSDYRLELSYFQVIDWNTSRAIGPDTPADWLVMRAPGSFFQTQDFTYQAMAWDYSTQLYNAEVNVRKNFSDRIAMLVGFRWLQLTENLQGSLTPADRFQPLWKYNPSNNLFDVAQVENIPGIPATGGFPPFWNTSTKNNLYGVQIGIDGQILEHGRFSLNGLIKVGGYYNNAEASTGVSIFKVVRPSHASTNHTSFVGEAGLQGKYQIIKNVSLKIGYEALWLQGVAVAPGQIQETYTSAPATVTALGVNCDSGVLFHGATVGLEYSF
jgi:hypothetical protein